MALKMTQTSPVATVAANGRDKVELYCGNISPVVPDFDDPLKWWKDILAIPGVSISVKHFFSSLKHTLSDARLSMTAETIYIHIIFLFNDLDMNTIHYEYDMGLLSTTLVAFPSIYRLICVMILSASGWASGQNTQGRAFACMSPDFSIHLFLAVWRPPVRRKLPEVIRSFETLAMWLLPGISAFEVGGMNSPVLSSVRVPKLKLGDGSVLWYNFVKGRRTGT
ncbi:hypothetical protein DFH08DRAFT_827070 [Mycena albidolilacea]|uniref:Uncharacterized protein n=1 Tax=Mycena albidolilacea TaxID=1033008 RepID=A0AAD7E8A2_9AGAR|nr:hypothetical protein DFH08DRAFT_827070 [Mycena albidolilacea]